MSTKKKKNINELPDRVKSLGFKSTREYFDWCKENHFKATLRKTSGELNAENVFIRRLHADNTLMEHRTYRKPKSSIEKLFNKEITPKNDAHSQINRLFCEHDKNPKILEFVLYLSINSKILDNPDSAYTRMCSLIFRNLSNSVRPLDTWKHNTHSVPRQIALLLRHLFAKYEMPAFMDNAWYGNDSRAVDWYLHLGQGNNIKTASKVPTLTKKMAHTFLSAPNKYNPMQAVRWAQAQGVGCDKRMAKAIAATCLSQYYTNNDFWITVIQFFANAPMFDTVQVEPIIDYIKHKKFGGRYPIFAEGDTPNFCMKGRTPNSLLKNMEEWHERLQKEKDYKRCNWEHSEIADFTFVEGTPPNLKTWKITELLTSKALRAEGSAMSHCVASYDQSCASRDTSIWSLTCDEKRMVTVEVNLRNPYQTGQVRGKYNRLPTPNEKNIISRWAGKEHINY